MLEAPFGAEVAVAAPAEEVILLVDKPVVTDLAVTVELLTLVLVDLAEMVKAEDTAVEDMLELPVMTVADPEVEAPLLVAAGPPVTENGPK